MFDWKKYHTLAKKEALENNEENKRSAISRAYYASFCSCRNKILEQDLADDMKLYIIENNLENLHKVVGDILDDGEYIEDKFLANNIAELLKESRIKRNSADYDDNYEGNLDNDVDTVLDNTEYILNNIDFLYPPL